MMADTEHTGSGATSAYPLQWPVAVSRTLPHRRGTPQFKSSIAAATRDIRNEVKLLGGKLSVISTNLELRNDGLPYANQKQPADPGVAVYFQHKGKALVFACDRWVKVELNMRAIVLTISALRGIARWGSTDMLDQAFNGFAALPGPTPSWPAPEQWWQVLGVDPHASPADIDAAYRVKAKAAHPDAGGSDAAMARLNAARDQAMLSA